MYMYLIILEDLLRAKLLKVLIKNHLLVLW